MRDFVFFAAVYGAAASLTILHIGAPYRALLTWIDRVLFRIEEKGPLKMLAHCPACTGFWLALGATFWHSPLGPWWLDRVMVALASTGIIWIVHVILARLGMYDL